MTKRACDTVLHLLWSHGMAAIVGSRSSATRERLSSKKTLDCTRLSDTCSVTARSKFVIHTAAVTGIAVVSVEFGPCSTVAALVLLFCDNVAYESDIISIAELSYLVSPTLGESVPRPPSAQHPQHWRSARGVPGQIGPLGGSGSRLCKLCISLISFKEVKQEGCWFCCSQLLGQLVI